MDFEQIAKKMWPGGIPRRVLEKFRITEISAVDRPAQAHAKAVIMKRDDVTKLSDEWGDLPDPQKPDEIPRRGIPEVRRARPGKKKKKTMKLAKIAKAVIELGGTTLPKSDFYSAIVSRAEKLREPGMSDAQAFTKAITSDEKGKLLYAAMQKAAGSDIPPRLAGNNATEAEMATQFGDPTPSDVGEKLNALARDLQNKEPGLSFASAYTRIITTPKHRPLYEQLRNDGLVRQLRGIGAMA